MHYSGLVQHAKLVTNSLRLTHYHPDAEAYPGPAIQLQHQIDVNKDANGRHHGHKGYPEQATLGLTGLQADEQQHRSNQHQQHHQHCHGPRQLLLDRGISLHEQHAQAQ